MTVVVTMVDQLGFGARQAADRASEDGDAVGHDPGVRQGRATGEVNALIQPEQGAPPAVELRRGGPVLDEDHHVFHHPPERFGDQIKGVGDEALEVGLVGVHRVQSAVPPSARPYDPTMQLSAEEGRVIGSLVEKQLTTPQQYPLTSTPWSWRATSPRIGSRSSPIASTSSRWPVTALRDAGLVGFMYPSHGRTVTRYRHVLSERLGLDERELALVAVLLLRGPQTAGELRARTERMAPFDGIGAVDADLERLSTRQEPLVLRLARRPGQKEERWVQLLTVAAASPPVEAAVEAGLAGAGPVRLPTEAPRRPRRGRLGAPGSAARFRGRRGGCPAGRGGRAARRTGAPARAAWGLTAYGA